MSKHVIEENGWVEAWFPRSREAANLRPALHKIEGWFEPGNPEPVVIRAWWFDGSVLHQVMVQAKKGEDWKPALAIALERSFQKFAG